MTKPRIAVNQPGVWARWLVGAVVCSSALGLCAQDVKPLIDLREAGQIRARRPVVIAHRGGVVTATAPECSLAAIERAARSGYDLVELDVQRSRDGAPIVFHDSSLLKACGRDGRVSDYLAAELLTFDFRGVSQKIVSLETALHKCRELGLGVMLDLKDGREDEPFLDRIDQLIVQCQLTTATVSMDDLLVGQAVVASSLLPAFPATSSMTSAAKTVRGDSTSTWAASA